MANGMVAANRFVVTAGPPSFSFPRKPISGATVAEEGRIERAVGVRVRIPVPQHQVDAVLAHPVDVPVHDAAVAGPVKLNPVVVHFSVCRVEQKRDSPW